MVFSKGPKNPFFVDDAGVIFPWFSGKETPMNRPGDRNFGLILTKQQADEIAAAGYNVKEYRPKTDDGPDMSIDPILWLKCKINFGGRKPPRIILITCIDGVCEREPLTEKTVMLLDSADIERVDCKFGPYDREASDTRTAYVQSLFVTVNLDKYDAKYKDMPWSGGDVAEGMLDTVDAEPGDDANE